jgi:transcriptional regulator with XRE-family HTH domain
MIFAQNVAKLKTAGGFNATQFEEFTGVSRRTLGRILANRRSRAGEYIPTATTVQRIAKTLSVPSEYVLKHRLDITVS